MPLKVVISERAEKNLDELATYLEKEFSTKTKQKFIEKLIETIKHISTNPYLYKASEYKKEIRKCVLTKQTAVYYKVTSTEIEIITIQDTRRNPKSLKL